MRIANVLRKYWACVTVRVYVNIYNRENGSTELKKFIEKMSYHTRAENITEAREKILSKAYKEYPNSGIILVSIKETM